MGRKARKIECGAEDRRRLEALARSRSESAGLVRRARAMLQCIDGRKITDIAHDSGVSPSAVAIWKGRYIEKGIDGLRDARRGRPRKHPQRYDIQVRSERDCHERRGRSANALKRLWAGFQKIFQFREDTI